MSTLSLTVNDKKITASEGKSVLEAALEAGIYIPSLCFHPDLPSCKGKKLLDRIFQGKEEFENDRSGPPSGEYDGCGLCLVEIEGERELQRSCVTPAREGLRVKTETEAVRRKRRENLSAILADHPHACLTCAQQEGCTREPCSTNVPVEERCCPKLGNCELQKVAEHVGIPASTPRYIPKGIPPIKDDPLIDRDYTLCIGCLRCVRACEDLRGVAVLGFTYSRGRVKVGSVKPTLKESECRFCGACIEVCPTGALLDRELRSGKKEDVLVPCRPACPLGIDIPGYIRLISQGKEAEALALIREKTPFPATLGSVCFHPCEEACNRAKVDEAVAICALKRYANARVSSLPREKIPKTPPSGKRVAVVGSGPSGLSAAYYLALAGHDVEVLEAEKEVGGMLRKGIPPYRLPREALERDLERIKKLGITLRTEKTLSKEYGLKELQERGFHAILFALGAQESKKLDLEGVDLQGVLWGLDFLMDTAAGKGSLPGERIIVIGGGNVAIDAAMTAIRVGAKRVDLACLESRTQMPAYPWEIRQAEEEGIQVRPSWGPVRILGDRGNVKGVQFKRCISVFDGEGRFNPKFDPNETLDLDADAVIFAIGQASDLSFLEGTGVLISPQGTIQTSGSSLESSIPGVFAAGEVVSGPSSVVEASAQGKRAAEAIDRWLGGRGIFVENYWEKSKPDPRVGRDEGFAFRPRTPVPCAPPEERTKGFEAIELGYGAEDAMREASRCLQCDLRLEITPPVLPPEKWLPFTADAVREVPATEGVFRFLDEEKKVFQIKGTMNLRKDLEQQLLINKRARFFFYEEEKMYTQRESELIQQFLQEHGTMPEGEDDLEDLF